MADRSVRVILAAQVAGFVAGMAQAQAAVDSTTAAIAKNNEQADRIASGLASVGAVAALGFGAAVKAFADYDQAMSAVMATGDDARANQEALGAAALEAGQRTVYSAVESAQAIESLMKAGLSAQEVLDGGLNGALDLAAAGSMEVAEAADVMATSLAQFNLQGAQAGHVADLLAAGAGKSVGEVHDLAMALKQSGTVASQFGISVEETVGGLALFAKNAIQGSDAGTSLRQMLLMLAKPTDDAQAMLNKYNIQAYDARGNFVGLAGLADQLQEKLGGLSQEQQNLALKTIFGADAIRTSTVLMREGGDAVRRWTKDVSDQGYATEMAATRLDNLKGDLEQLTGSLETFGVKMGSQADGPMRSFVQGLTALINVAADADPAIQGVAMAALGSVAAVGLLGGGTLKLVTSLGQAREAAQTLGWSLKGITASAGAIGVVLTVAAIAFGRFAEVQADAQQATDDYTAAIKADSGALAENTRQAVANRLEKSGALKAAQDLGLSLHLVTDAVLGEGDAMERVRAVTAPYAEDYRDLSAAAQQRAQAASDLEKALGSEATHLQDGEESYRRQAEAARDGADATGNLAASTDLVGVATQNTRKSVDDYVASIYGLKSAYLDLLDSTIQFEAALDDTATAIKRNGAGLDDNTEKGRANLSALSALAQKTQEHIGKMLEQGESAKSVGIEMDRSRAAFIASAIAAGKSATAAAKMADDFGMVASSSYSAKANQDAAARAFKDAAQKAGIGADKARDLWQQLKKIPPKTPATIEVKIKQPNISAELALVQARINKNPLYIPARVSGRVYGLSTGGWVRGPGTTTSDSILAALSDREYVLRAWAVDKIGLSRLDFMNRYGKLPHFAEGGYTGTSYGPQMPAQPLVMQTSAPAATTDGAAFAAAVRSGIREALNGADIRITGADKMASYVEGRIELRAGRGEY